MPDRLPSSGRSSKATGLLLVACWAVILGVVVGVGWLLIHPLEGSVGEVDDDVARWFAHERTDRLNDLANAGTFFGDTIVELVVAPVVAMGVWIWQRSVVPALFLALVTCGVGGIYYVAVNVTPANARRSRSSTPVSPRPTAPVGPRRHGHCVVRRHRRPDVDHARAARWWVTPLLLVPLVVAVARLYQGAHHLSDVLVSLVFASVWLGTVAAAPPAGSLEAVADGTVRWRHDRGIQHLVHRPATRPVR